MKIAVYQLAPEFGDKQRNLNRIEKAVQTAGADLVVLPELCATGYQFTSRSEAADLCESIPEGESIRKLIDLSRKHNCHIVAGVGEKAGDALYNSAVLTGPDGVIGVYRKVHLFWDEKLWFQPGDLGFPVWDIGSAKIGIMICFDWIFPEAARSLALAGADVICHPVNLVLPYCQDAMVTRCVENRIFIVTANRIGTEARGGRDPLTFTGGSQIVDPRGNIQFRMASDAEDLQACEIDPTLARDKQITPCNHLWEDRRPDQYEAG